MDFLFTAGLGDLIALESVFTDVEREQLRTCYWATRAANISIELFRATACYQHVRHVVLDDASNHFGANTLHQRYGLDPSVVDWSVLQSFGGYASRDWQVSRLLTDAIPLSLSRFDLPPAFVVCHAQTTLHTNQDERQLRGLDPAEWARILDRASFWSTRIVVVGSPDEPRPPLHPCIIDLVGQTSIPESLAILRASSGFWGIASWLATAACQLFGPEDLWIKAPLSWGKGNRHIYFAPHPIDDMPFLFDRLTDSQPSIRPGSTKRYLCMKLLRPFHNQLVAPGTIIEATDDEARIMLANGNAEEIAPRRGPLRQAVRPPLRRALQFEELDRK